MILTFALPVLYISCTSEHDEWDRYGETLITISLSLPYVDGGGGTRAITVSEENQIDTIQILALSQNGNDWVFDYMATDLNIAISGTNSNTLSATASVKVLPTPQQFIIIANGADELNHAAPIRGEKIVDIEHRLISTTGVGEWPAHNNDEELFVPIPMYGRTSSYTVKAIDNNAIISSIPMIRMVARIDVSLKSTVSNFILEDACLFNYKTAGYVSYINSGFNGSVVTKPAVPDAGNHPADSIIQPTVRYLSDKSSVPRGTIQNAIYTFESPAIENEQDKRSGTALVVGGFFNGSSVKTYYRIDLKWNTKTSFVSDGILRNHSFNVVIQSVKVAGHSSPLEAYLGNPLLTAEVKGWNMMEQNVSSGTQYYLKVSESSIKLTSENNYSCTITAETDYNTDIHGFPAGIQVGKITYSADGSTYHLPGMLADDWLKVKNEGSATNAELVFSLMPNTPLDENRFAKVKVSAGNFTRMIDVELQSKKQYH